MVAKLKRPRALSKSLLRSLPKARRLGRGWFIEFCWRSYMPNWEDLRRLRSTRRWLSASLMIWAGSKRKWDRSEERGVGKEGRGGGSPQRRTEDAPRRPGETRRGAMP